MEVNKMMRIAQFFFLAILCAISSACVSVDYHADSTTEHLEVKTLFKSIDGLWAERNESGFSIVVDKTYTHDPMRSLAELLEMIDELYGMGIRIDRDFRSPLLNSDG